MTREVVLRRADDDITRATKIMQIAGMTINALAQDQLIPRMAEALRAYRELDKSNKEAE
jgi:predicted transcriptional regulator